MMLPCLTRCLTAKASKSAHESFQPLGRPLMWGRLRRLGNCSVANGRELHTQIAFLVVIKMAPELYHSSINGIKKRQERATPMPAPCIATCRCPFSSNL